MKLLRCSFIKNCTGSRILCLNISELNSVLSLIAITYFRIMVIYCGIFPDHCHLLRYISRSRSFIPVYIQITVIYCGIFPDHGHLFRYISRSLSFIAVYSRIRVIYCGIFPDHGHLLRYVFESGSFIADVFESGSFIAVYFRITVIYCGIFTNHCRGQGGRSKRRTQRGNKCKHTRARDVTRDNLAKNSL